MLQLFLDYPMPKACIDCAFCDDVSGACLASEETSSFFFCHDNTTEGHNLDDKKRDSRCPLIDLGHDEITNYAKGFVGMNHCGVGSAAKKCDGCPYSDEGNCDAVLYADARNLLKEQNQRIWNLLCERKQKETQPKEKARWLNDTTHWIEGERPDGDSVDTFRCSWCGYYMYFKTPFCPHCGAEMEEGDVE